MLDVLGQGVYSFSEAARLTRTNVNRLRYWFLGRKDGLPPLRESDCASWAKGPCALSFLDLVDALMVGRIRDEGVSLQYLRKAHEALIREFNTPHPFSRRNLLTDGKQIFVHVAHEFEDERLRELVTSQYAFPKILRPYLRQLEYEPASLLARRWHVYQGIVIDPDRQFGKPVVESNGIPAAVIAAAYRANDLDADLVADWYGISPDEVRLAVAFEADYGIAA